MNRNEYRRAFIMLRAVEQGYGGHARLERRTLSGSLYFVITAPQGVESLTAMLAGQRDGQYFAAPIGTLARDRRGQLTLAWQFDPRSIDGRPLEAYAWIAVVANGRTLALTGNLEGSRPLDLAALRRAVIRLAASGDAPAADLPAPGEFIPANADAGPYIPPEPPVEPEPESPSAPEIASADAQAENPPAAQPDSPAPVQSKRAQDAPPTQAGLFLQTRNDGGDCPQPDRAGSAAPSESEEAQGESPVQAEASPQDRPDAGEQPRPAPVDPAAPTDAARDDDRCDVKIYTRVRSRTAKTVPSSGGNAPMPSERAAEPPASPLPADAAGDNASASAQPRQSLPSQAVPQPWNAILPSDGARNAPEPRPVPAVQTAARMLGLDITSPWPPAAEPLRRLFATLAPAENAPEDGFVYVAAPMPAASGYGACLVGMKAAEGRPTALRYALPARYAPEPPAGLEAYRWADLGDGSGAWVLDVEII